MNQPDTTPEFILAELPGIRRMGNGQHHLDTQLDSVAAELALLFKEVSMSVDILREIANSIHVLQQSLPEPQ